MSTNAVWLLPVTVCRITDFLGKQASAALLERAVAAANGAMTPSTIDGDKVIPDVRRSRSCWFAAPELLEAINEVREAVEHMLDVSCHDTEPSYCLNMHNDGDFYRAHQDNDGVACTDRLLTFVYYLHGTPRPFQGGELRVFDVPVPLTPEKTATWGDRTWRDWEPEHDSIVFFRPTVWHEVRKVICPSGRPEDSRFAVNGWLCRRPKLPSSRDAAS
ncbi:2OG-Fe(II) oxygenase [Streptomyces sp. RY43-2]|uniref:2OG-Fe(II) oxygenase n=1 Tax=Streptomyces macrolidinus TaxID=2952607 RepID=A0ABT0ZD76_9ACTN|nr:2OG-Fe(II) oxygenase [Streptomyces macrolidinus]MCN9241532.1 2OG-Fe(II) oxygenase [Streptomyces macrolidinus]